MLLGVVENSEDMQSSKVMRYDKHQSTLKILQAMEAVLQSQKSS